MLKRFFVATVRQNQLQIWRFFGNLRVRILIVVTGTPKRHILVRDNAFLRIFRKNVFMCVGCSVMQVPKER